jgi:hypothetical protein
MTAAANGAYNVSLTGATNTVGGASTFSNTGTLTLGDASGDATTFTAGLTATAPSVSLAGTLATTNTALALGAVTLTADGTFLTGSGTATLASATDGGGSFVLALGDAAQTGLMAINGSVTVNALTTAGGAYGVSLLGGGTINTAATFLNTGTTTLGDASGDTVTFTGGLTATAGSVSAAGTINTTNAAMSLGAVTVASAQSLRRLGRHRRGPDAHLRCRDDDGHRIDRVGDRGAHAPGEQRELHGFGEPAGGRGSRIDRHVLTRL